MIVLHLPKWIGYVKEIDEEGFFPSPFCFRTASIMQLYQQFKVVAVFVFVESTVAWSSYILIYLACWLLENMIYCWVYLPLPLPWPQPLLLPGMGTLAIKQRGVKRSPEKAWKNTCSFLSIIYSVHKVSNSPFKRCKSLRKAVFNDLHLIFMIHMAFHPKCQKRKKKIAIHMAA